MMNLTIEDAQHFSYVSIVLVKKWKILWRFNSYINVQLMLTEVYFTLGLYSEGLVK